MGAGTKIENPSERRVFVVDFFKNPTIIAFFIFSKKIPTPKSRDFDC
jgi:hypothetical protein